MQQLHPKSVWLFFIKFATMWFFIVLGAGFGIFQISLLFKTDQEGKIGLDEFWSAINLSLVLILVLLVLIFFVCYMFAKLSYKYYKYELREEGFRKESGVIWKHYVIIPYDRIQNVDIFRGVFDRVLGLSELHIQTAGISGYGKYGSGTEGKLPGIAPDVAEKLRDELIHRVRTNKNQGL